MQHALNYAPQLHLYNSVFNQTLFTVDLVRLRHEKEILENGLATCVMYLHILRKKQARYERVLNHASLSTCRKRKHIEQRKKELDREIRNKHNDEQAFWNNLEACKANIYVAERLPYTPTDLSSTSTGHTSRISPKSCNEAEPARISWNGWTEDATLSPFRKRRSNPSFDKEVAPDELITESDHETISVQNIRRSSALIRNAEEMMDLPVPPNTAHLNHRHCSFIPKGPMFEPRVDSLADIDDFEISTPKSVNCAKFEEDRQCTEAGITRAFQRLSIDTQSDLKPERNHTRCNTTSQRSPRRDTFAGVVRRRRSSLL